MAPTITLFARLARYLLVVGATVAMLVISAGPVPAAAHEHHHYKLIVIGTLGGPYSSSPALNASGVTVGWSATTIPMPPTGAQLVCGGEDHIGLYVTVAFQFKKGVLTNLGTLGGPSSCSEPFLVNDQGVIVGSSENGDIDPLANGNVQEQGNVTRAVLWKDGKIEDLGSLGGNQNLAFWINNRGQIVGWGSNNIPDPYSMIYSLFYGTANGTQTRAFLWDHGKIKDLGTLGGDDAAALYINERGEVAGTSYTSTVPNPITGLPPADPFLWEPPTAQFPEGRMIDLGSFGGANGYSQALNNRGQVIGGSSIASNPGACFFLNFFPDCHPFLWDHGKLRDLNTTTIGGNPLSAQWFNDAGEIVGFAEFPNPGGSVFDAYLWRDGVAMDLGHFSGDCGSTAWGINASGQVVGTSNFACDFDPIDHPMGFPDHAFLWENGDLVDLNSLIPQGSSFVLIYTGPQSQVPWSPINDRGEIVGLGAPPDCNDATACGSAFLLIPCDEDHPGIEGCDYSPMEVSTVAGSHSAPQRQLTPQEISRIHALLMNRHRGFMPRTVH
jgi:probable HAF family extracellular repeat protein